MIAREAIGNRLGIINKEKIQSEAAAKPNAGLLYNLCSGRQAGETDRP